MWKTTTTISVSGVLKLNDKLLFRFTCEGTCIYDIQIFFKKQSWPSNPYIHMHSKFISEKNFWQLKN